MDQKNLSFDTSVIFPNQMKLNRMDLVSKYKILEAFIAIKSGNGSKLVEKMSHFKLVSFFKLKKTESNVPSVKMQNFSKYFVIISRSSPSCHLTETVAFIQSRQIESNEPNMKMGESNRPDKQTNKQMDEFNEIR